MGIFTELRKGGRQREAYKNQVRILVRELQEARAETAKLRRKLENVQRYVKESLA
jgi:predicted RNase H-like nuclease (RuvC/YqgF family)